MQDYYHHGLNGMDGLHTPEATKDDKCSISGKWAVLFRGH